MAVELINWQFRQISNHAESPLIPNQWYDTKNFTSHQIHTDLLEANIIPDPFIDDNEIYVQWISELNCNIDVYLMHQETLIVMPV